MEKLKSSGHESKDKHKSETQSATHTPPPATTATATTKAPSTPSQQPDWDLLRSRLEKAHPGARQVLSRFGRDLPAGLAHLLAVHEGACRCCSSRDNSDQDDAKTLSKTWSHRKAAFVAACKLSGLSFDDFLLRVLKLVMANSGNMQGVDPVSEEELWMYLRQNGYHEGGGGGGGATTATNELDEDQSILISVCGSSSSSSD